MKPTELLARLHQGNVQSVKGQIKPYQTRQLLKLIDQYKLQIEVGK